MRRHLLLGNGFSVSLHGAFGYDTLYAVAIRENRALAFTFSELGVADGNFEEALARAQSEEQRAQIRRGLIAAVRAVHPYSIDHAALASCGRFLASFIDPERGDRRGSIFTTNYDLLLYRVGIYNREWLGCYDAFDADGYWNWPLRSGSQFFYLHGATHIFRHQVRPLKGTEKPGATRYFKLLAFPHAPLLPQVSERLKRGDFPVFVTQGSAPEKQAEIGRHDYLRKVHRHFSALCKLPNTALFTVGHALGEVDQHIADAIGDSDLEAVYIGAYSDADWARADELAQQWARRRQAERRSPIVVSGFDVRECPIWSEREGRKAA